MPPSDDFDWRAILEGSDMRYHRFRSILRRIPSEPRCKVCAAPFAGPGAPLMRVMGRTRWEKNPNYCRACEALLDKHHGGAEVELSMLFADIRGSTTMAEGMAPAEFSALLNDFYDLAARVIVAHDGVVHKFVGDEVVAWFVIPFAGFEHAKAAIDAATTLVTEAGRATSGKPGIPVGAAVHTGIAYVGSLGEGDVTEFTALGDNVNVTARLASAAAAGEVLVSRAAANAAQLDTTSLASRRLDLRGRSEPMDVVVIRADAATPVSA
jgi:adenylate cyclase